MMKYVFTIDDRIVKIAQKEDFICGYEVSYNLPNDIKVLMEKISYGEIMEGIYEIQDKNKIREILLSYGLIENKGQLTNN